MNNEPVAYGKYLEEHDYWVTVSGIIPNPKEGYVPLYTHPSKESKTKDRFSNYETICLQCGVTVYKPAKTLTDEEIIKVFEGRFHEKPTGKIDDEVIAFARAILRKAQEK
jgi:hypothetical protein